MEDSRKRNMERRRETSRYAARDRRAKESDIYDDLKEVVPVVEEPTVTHVDRIALLRVAATVCRYRKNAGNALTNSPMSAEMLRNTSFREQQGMSPWCEDALSECLDGFIIIADSDGVLLYVTESVSIFLGLTQTDFAGRHLKDFCHSDDYKEFLNHTTELTANKTSEESRQCTLRIKSVISPRGRNLNLKSAVYKAISCTLRVLPSPAGHCTLIQAATSPAGQGTVSSTANAMSKNGEAQTGTFMTRHTCDMRISYVSDALNGMLKADSRSLMGASFYELVHPADAESVRKCIQELLQKGHTRTPYYRLVTASGSLAWILTEATTISHTTRGQKGQYIICIHHLLGQQTEEECERGAVEGIAAGFQVCIKKEIDDNEYLGRQPEVMECVEFCPLIGGEADVDAFEPVPAARPPAHANRALPSYARGAAVDQQEADDCPLGRRCTLRAREDDYCCVMCVGKPLRRPLGTLPHLPIGTLPTSPSPPSTAPEIVTTIPCKKARLASPPAPPQDPARSPTRTCCSGFFVTSQRVRLRRAAGLDQSGAEAGEELRDESGNRMPEHLHRLVVMPLPPSLTYHLASPLLPQRSSATLVTAAGRTEEAPKGPTSEATCCRNRRNLATLLMDTSRRPLRSTRCRRASRALATSPPPRLVAAVAPSDRPLRLSQLRRWSGARGCGEAARSFVLPPLLHDAQPPFQQQILSHCPSATLDATRTGDVQICSPLCLLPIFQVSQRAAHHMDLGPVPMVEADL